MENVSRGIETMTTYSFGRTQQIFSNVEVAVREIESNIGIDNLEKHISSLPEDVVLNHVDHHRKFIRLSSWGHDLRDTSHGQFLDDFEQSCLAYVRVAKEVAIAAAIQGDHPAKLAEKVYAAEALRGQFGKRAPYGLDARLERICAKVEDVLHMLSEDMIDGVLYYFGTPVAYGVPTAEDLFCSDFMSVVANPTSEQIAIADCKISPDNRSAYERFKRRHSKWSVILEKAIENRTDARAIASSLLDKSPEKSCLERSNLIERIKAVLDADAEQALVQHLSEIADLNHLNLSLEPLFSFKGGVGLLQYGQIRNTPVFDGNVAALNAIKWELLEKEQNYV